MKINQYAVYGAVSIKFDSFSLATLPPLEWLRVFGAAARQSKEVAAIADILCERGRFPAQPAD